MSEASESAADRDFVDLSRKEFARLPRNPELENAVAAAAVSTGERFGTVAYEKQLRTAIGLCGKTLVALMREGDEPTLFVPMWLSQDGGPEQLGVLLTCGDRAIVAWTEGNLRLRYFAQAIPYTSVHRTDLEAPSPGYCASVRVEAANNWVFNLLKPMFKDASIADAVVSRLGGSDDR